MARYFTKQQIEEIARRLATESVRDTDLSETVKLGIDDYVAIVQDGKNRKINADKFREELKNGPRGYSAYEVAVLRGYTGTEEEWLASLKGNPGDIGPIGKSAYQSAVDNGFEGTEAEWVYLMTKASRDMTIVETELEDVVHHVDSGSLEDLEDPSAYATRDEYNELRTKIDGMSTGKYYGFHGSEEDLPEATDPGYAYVGESAPYALWNFDGLEWKDSGVTVDNAPVGNEEDIDLDEAGLLKLADRPTSSNQMGYVILRKNKTFAEQVTQENTIYEIRYEFDLGGDTVSIPDGCVLKFEGGKLTNGALSGRIRNTEGRMSWFGGGFDAKNLSFLSSCNKVLVDRDITLNESVPILGNSTEIDVLGNEITVGPFDPISNTSVIVANTKEAFSFHDAIINFGGTNLANDDTVEREGVAAVSCQYTHLYNLTFKNYGARDSETPDNFYCINVIARLPGQKVNIHDCSFSDVYVASDGVEVSGKGNGRCIYVSHVAPLVENACVSISRCQFTNCYNVYQGQAFIDDFDCIYVYSPVLEDERRLYVAEISGCHFTNVSKRAVKAQSARVAVRDCTCTFTDDLFFVTLFHFFGDGCLAENITISFRGSNIRNRCYMFGSSGKNCTFNNIEVFGLTPTYGGCVFVASKSCSIQNCYITNMYAFFNVETTTSDYAHNETSLPDSVKVSSIHLKNVSYLFFDTTALNGRFDVTAMTVDSPIYIMYNNSSSKNTLCIRDSSFVQSSSPSTTPYLICGYIEFVDCSFVNSMYSIRNNSKVLIKDSIFDLSSCNTLYGTSKLTLINCQSIGGASYLFNIFGNGTFDIDVSGCVLNKGIFGFTAPTSKSQIINIGIANTICPNVLFDAPSLANTLLNAKVRNSKIGMTYNFIDTDSFIDMRDSPLYQSGVTINTIPSDNYIGSRHFKLY